KSDLSVPKKEKIKNKDSKNESNAKNRRLDSIAWLIQGNDVCGASFFYGKYLFIATNKSQASLLTQKVLDYLKEVADWSSRLASTSDQSIEACEKACEKSRKNLLEYVFRNIDFFKNNKGSDEEYRKAFFRALLKTTRSIIYSYTKNESH